MKKFVVGTFCLVAFALGIGHANADFITFFGEDLSTGRTVPAGGNAATAAGNFLSNLSGGVGVESFEGFTDGQSPPYSISFPGSTGSITATLTDPTASGNTYICGPGNCLPPAAGEFATDGVKWLAASSANLNIAFSEPIAAFGFYGTDIGDFGGQLTLTLTNGGTVLVTVPNTIGSGNVNGDLLFYGFIDTVSTYTNIAFGNTGAGTDFFGFDQMTIGDLRQVKVPEPSTLLLLGSGLLGLWGFRRKFKK